MKILLINLPRDGEVRDVATPDYLLYDFMNYPPLGLLAIAAGVDQRHELSVLDTVTSNMDIGETVRYIQKHKPDLLGISVVTRRLFSMCAIARAVRESMPDVRIVAGGPHLDAFPIETMNLGVLHYGLQGFCERSFPELVESLASGDAGMLAKIPGLLYMKGGELVMTGPPETPVDLDALPLPDRTLINLDDYFSAADRLKMTTVYTSRGCPFRCVFCDVGDKTFRYRSPARIVDEFESVAAMGVREIHIFDDTFNVDRQRVIDMCAEILRRGLKISWSARVRVAPFDREMAAIMKKAGCARLNVGVEAFDDRILEKIKKNTTVAQIRHFFSVCHEFNIDTLAYFIVGFPDETREYRATLYSKLKSLKATYLYLNVLYPSANSELYKELLKSGLFDKDYWKDFITHPVRDFELPLCRDAALQQELVTLVDDIHRRFYLSPRFIVSDLRRTTTVKMLLRKSRLAVKMMVGAFSKPDSRA